MSDQWTRDKIMNLIRVYRSKECLWKISNKEYTDRNKRNIAWASLAKTIGSDVRSVERKVKTLKTQFLYYYKQVLRKRVNGKTNSAYKPRWFAYDALRFLQHGKEVRTLGPEEASKNRPSNLSIDVWHLMENARKNDSDADRSDENSQDIDGSTHFQAILDKLTTSSSPEISIHEIKLEANNDEYSEETSQTDPLQRDDTYRTKDEEIRNSEPMQLGDQMTGAKRNDMIHYIGENVKEYNVISSPVLHQKERIESAVWNFEATQKEHNLKLQVLNVELERAELQKQTALNELTTSELKKQLIEGQAAEFYSQVRMIGERGSGAGKGGGGGGAIREAGGSFGKMEAAHEDQYFYEQQKEQLKKIREGLHDEISFHEEQIKRHQEAINRHKKRIGDMSHE